MHSDAYYMEQALKLAEKGRGHTRPNPLVGAVLVKDGAIVGVGYHQAYGGPHAEIHALHDARDKAEGSTLYVTLEPCSHHGKTPPCCEAIAAAKVSRVVCALEDPNPLVNGKGLAYLQAHGIEIASGVLSDQAKKQNEVFFHYIEKERPFVTVKTAMSLDGKIATSTRESKWITGSESRAYVHRMRAESSAIMVGVNTVLQDDPLLTARTDDPTIQQPIRVIMDSFGRTPMNSRLFQTIDLSPLIIITTTAIAPETLKSYRAAGAEVITLPISDREQHLLAALHALTERGIDSLLVEGGGTLAESFFRAHMVQKLVTFIAPIVIGGKDALTPVEGEGISNLQDASKFSIDQIKHLGNDIMIEAYYKQEGLCSPDSSKKLAQ